MVLSVCWRVHVQSHTSPGKDCLDKVIKEMSEVGEATFQRLFKSKGRVGSPKLFRGSGNFVYNLHITNGWKWPLKSEQISIFFYLGKKFFDFWSVLNT